MLLYRNTIVGIFVRIADNKTIKSGTNHFLILQTRF